MARTPLDAKVVCDEFSSLTTIVVSRSAPKNRVSTLAKRAKIMVAPSREASHPRLDLRWLMARLGSENVTSFLVEGGGETNASFLFNSLARRVTFFYAPRILGGNTARKAVAGEGVESFVRRNSVARCGMEKHRRRFDDDGKSRPIKILRIFCVSVVMICPIKPIDDQFQIVGAAAKSKPHRGEIFVAQGKRVCERRPGYIAPMTLPPFAKSRDSASLTCGDSLARFAIAPNLKISAIIRFL